MSLVAFGGSALAEEKKKSIEEVMAERQALLEAERGRIEALRKQLGPLLGYEIDQLQAAIRIKVVDLYGGTKVLHIDDFNDDIKYLGTIDSEFASDSIFNEFGSFGSEFSSDSIWNEFGQYGGEFSQKSPFNKFTSNPPVIVRGRKVVGKLSVNSSIPGAVSPAWLRTYFSY